MADEYPWSVNELIVNELYTESNPSSGKCPKPLESNWMMRWRQKPPVRKTKYTVFIDDLKTNDTICQAESVEAGMELIWKMKKEGVRACLRVEEFDEARLKEEEDNSRQRARWSRGFGA